MDDSPLAKLNSPKLSLQEKRKTKQEKNNDAKQTLSSESVKNEKGGGAGQLFLAIVVLLILIVSGLLAFVFRAQLGINLNSLPLLNERGEQEQGQQDVDKRPLELQVRKKERTVYNPFTEVTVISNKEIKIEEHNRVNWELVGQKNQKYYYIAKVINLPIDETTITLDISDEVGNQAQEVLKITRENYSFPVGFEAIAPAEDAEYILAAENYTGKIGKSKRLLEDFAPQEVVNLNETFGIYTLNDATLEANAARELDNMLTAMRQDIGKSVTVASGYRSFQTQLETYAGWVQRVGEKRANEISAKPGHSEHQLGTTVDFVAKETNWKIDASFADTEQSKWLRKNASDYGFKQFLNGEQTDYIEEPWQYRYINTTDSS